MHLDAPTIADFKSYFKRDFPFGDTESTVGDDDIQKALDEASVNLNPVFFTTQKAYTIGYLSLTAHFLVMNFRASSQGISGTFQWLEASKGVGSVNQSFSIPQYILDHPVLSLLSKTTYGTKYLSMILGQLAGQMFSVCGATKA